ncbi:MAG TPA: LytTR family DNA-binding domain-containing protein [Candidatus Bathyarchaeia archaeon]|jgi:two-component system LytT family response regulator|nr:LytTR family DNA-binding domain-containing protein [Candidatus Bathyarchaeia archaeon]
MTIRAAVVDDEPLARRAILRFLKNDSELEIVAECGDGQSAVGTILAKKPDLVFLDVQMPEMDGFEVVRRIGPERMPLTIFVTAFDRYAIRAFDANAIDYLLKPVGAERFTKALARVRARIAEKSSFETAQRMIATLEEIKRQHEYADRLPVLENGRILFVKTKEIDWIEADGNYARLHVGPRTHEIRETLSALERKLSPRDFLRIHRSTIVNVHFIKEIQPWFHGYHLVLLQNGQELRLSRYQDQIAKQLGLVSHSQR